MRVINFNARSVVNNSDAMKKVFLAQNFYVVAITKTWLSFDIASDCIVPPDYKLRVTESLEEGL